MSQYLPHIKPLYGAKEQCRITTNYFYKNFIKTPLIDGVFEKGIKKLFANYPPKETQETRLSYLIKKAFPFWIKTGWSLEYLEGSYNIGSELAGSINVGLAQLVGRLTFSIGLAFQIAKYLLVTMGHLVFYTIAVPILITALLVDRIMIRSILYFVGKNDAYNQAIDHKLTKYLPEKYAHLIQILRGYSTKKIEEKPQLKEEEIEQKIQTHLKKEKEQIDNSLACLQKQKEKITNEKAKNDSAQRLKNLKQEVKNYLAKLKTASEKRPVLEPQITELNENKKQIYDKFEQEENKIKEALKQQLEKLQQERIKEKKKIKRWISITTIAATGFMTYLISEFVNFFISQERTIIPQTS